MGCASLQYCHCYIYSYVPCESTQVLAIVDTVNLPCNDCEGRDMGAKQTQPSSETKQHAFGVALGSWLTQPHGLGERSPNLDCLMEEVCRVAQKQ